jgi:hypothetical protein
MAQDARLMRLTSPYHCCAGSPQGHRSAMLRLCGNDFGYIKQSATSHTQQWIPHTPVSNIWTPTALGFNGSPKSPCPLSLNCTTPPPALCSPRRSSTHPPSPQSLALGTPSRSTSPAPSWPSGAMLAGDSSRASYRRRTTQARHSRRPLTETNPQAYWNSTPLMSSAPASGMSPHARLLRLKSSISWS